MGAIAGARERAWWQELTRCCPFCTYECTFCEVCALSTLRNVCPNCGGNFQHRPIRTRAQLAKHPARTEPHPVGIDEASHANFFARYRNTPPGER